MSLFQPSAGWTALAEAFEKKLAGQIRLGAEVVSIHNLEQGVKVVYKDKAANRACKADLCICTIPCPCSAISTTISPPTPAGPSIRSPTCPPEDRPAVQTSFLEEDEDNYAALPIPITSSPDIYPSYDYLSGKGILIGYYNFNEKARPPGNCRIFRESSWHWRKEA